MVFSKFSIFEKLQKLMFRRGSVACDECDEGDEDDEGEEGCEAVDRQHVMQLDLLW